MLSNIYEKVGYIISTYNYIVFKYNADKLNGSSKDRLIASKLGVDKLVLLNLRGIQNKVAHLDFLQSTYRRYRSFI